MNKSRLLTILGLLLFCAVVLSPPIVYDYVYPNGGDDAAAAHLLVLDSIKAGNPVMTMYMYSVPYKIVGYPIVWIGSLTGLSIDTLFLWFSYLALALIGVTIYFTMSRLLNRMAGWLSLILVLFCAHGVLFQFHWGQIFNAINIGLILPLLLFFTVRYITQGKVYQLVVALLLSGLFGAFHVSGVYLPFVAGFLTVAYAVYCLVKRRHIQVKIVAFGGSIIVLSAVVFLFNVTGVYGIGQVAVQNAGRGLGISLGSYLMIFVSPTILVMLAFVGVFYKDALRNITDEAKVLAVILAGAVIGLAVPAFSGLSVDSFRQGLDLVTVLALLVAIPISLFVWTNKNRAVVILLLFAVGFGLCNSLPLWFSYSSAIRPADKEAIAYVNTLNQSSYNCSPQVAYWIYNRFTTAQYKNAPDGEGSYAPILIVRDIPMTPKSDPRNEWYIGYGIEPDDGYVLLKTFSDDKVTVDVYENMEEGEVNE